MWSHDQLETILSKVSADTARLTEATGRRIAASNRISENDSEIKALSENAIAVSRENLDRQRG